MRIVHGRSTKTIDAPWSLGAVRTTALRFESRVSNTKGIQPQAKSIEREKKNEREKENTCCVPRVSFRHCFPFLSFFLSR